MRINLTAIGTVGCLDCIGLAAWSGIGDAKSPVPATTNKTYTVQPGDTLWSIVTSHHEYDNQDPRDIVYQIELKNHMKDSTIVDGQAIQLP